MWPNHSRHSFFWHRHSLPFAAQLMHLAAFIEIASPQTPPSLFIALDALGETLAVPHRSFKFTNLLQIVNLLKMMYI